MWLLIFNLGYKKSFKKEKIRGYKTIHTFTKRIEDKTNDDDNNNSINNNNNNNNNKNNKKTETKK